LSLLLKQLSKYVNIWRSYTQELKTDCLTRSVRLQGYCPV